MPTDEDRHRHVADDGTAVPPQEPREPEGEPAREAGESRSLGAEDIPALVRMGMRAGVRTAAWGAGTALLAWRRASEAVLPETELGRTTREALADAARRLLGDELEEAPPRPPDPSRRGEPGDEASSEALRRRGAELLERAAELDPDEETHPAYARILGQLAPDEARILRLLEAEGPQPAMDVRAWRPLRLGSSVVASGLSMIGQRAGCWFPDRVPAYLNNLFRLGLIWFSREPVDDEALYEVLEAQPDVSEAIDAAGQPRKVRRSIRLTPFGEDFCRACLPPVDAARK